MSYRPSNTTQQQPYRPQPPPPPPSPPPQPTTQFTRTNLDRVPAAPSNRELWLAKDENFERLPLGLGTGRTSGRDMVADWERSWQEAGRR